MTLIFIDDLEDLKDDPLLIQIRERLPGSLSQKYFSNGKTALDFFTEQLNLGEPCIIMLDMSFPANQMTGIEILEKIRTLSRNTPVIIFTGVKNSADEITKLINLGTFYFLEKDASAKAILEIIKKAVNYYHTNITAALNEWLSANSPETQKKHYFTTIDGKEWTMEQLRDEIRKETPEGREFELNILKLTVDLIARNKEKIDG